jgi:hypothetical protein
MLGCVVKGAVGVSRFAFPTEGEATASVNIDITCEKGTRLAERDFGFHSLVKIAVCKITQMSIDPVLQRIGQINLFAGNMNMHSDVLSCQLQAGPSRLNKMSHTRCGPYQALAALTVNKTDHGVCLI